jgi:predicted nucleotidyltransferase
MEKPLDAILNNETKVKIIRVFTSHTEGYCATGREIARRINVTAPTAHTALRELYEYQVLKREISGRNYLYSLNRENRTVKDMLLPIFEKEYSFKKDIFTFITKAIKEKRIEKHIVSVIFYGSQQTEKTYQDSDVDIAVVVKNKNALKTVEDVFIEEIDSSFRSYFGISLDVYIKTKKDFIDRLKKKMSPVSSLIKSYSMIYGVDPLDWI